jgi:hypothetical protein
MLRHRDGGEECFLSRHGIRRIALKQNFAADAVTARDEGACFSLLGLCERTVEHRQGGIKVTSACVHSGKLHFVRRRKDRHALFTAIRNSDRPAMSHGREQPPGYAPDPTVADRRPISNLVVEARRYSALAVDTLVELTKDNHADSTRYAAATALLDRGYGRPAQSLDLHLSADAITKRLSDMTDTELAALGQRTIAAAPIVLEATAEVSDDAGE